ncbi:Aquaporin NIP3-1 [Bienertia sinuspersici]
MNPQVEVTVSVPETPTPEGTPAPLFQSRRVDSVSYDRSSMPRCNNCFPDGPLAMGSGPFKPASLTSKLLTLLSPER